MGTSLLAVLTTNTIQLISSHFLKRVLKLREGREGGREGGGGGGRGRKNEYTQVQSALMYCKE